MRLASLRATLLLWLLVPLAILLPLRTWFEYRQVVQATNDAFDRALADTALALADVLHTEAGRVVFPLSPQTERSLRMDQTDKVYFAVLDGSGRAIAGDAPLAALPLAAASGPIDFVDAHLAGEPIRVALRSVPCDGAACQVRVAETLSKRERNEQHALRNVIIFFTLLSATLVGVVLVATSNALRPLLALGQQVEQRSLNDLRPLDATHTPTEALPLIQAINRLFRRVDESSKAQRAFLDDASHQLRTPLTALRTESELALLEPDPMSMAANLRRIHAAADRAARLADQLLSLTRTEAAWKSQQPAEALDLRTLAEQAAADWVPQALAAGIDLGFNLEPAPIHGYPYLLRELLANLLHNAIEHAPTELADTRITVRTLVDDAGGSVLEVEDNGPGIAPSDRSRVLERFQRGRDARRPGSGLGLAIVRDIAEGHGAQLVLGDGHDPDASRPGLCVRVSFPPMPEPPKSRAAKHERLPA